MTAHRKVPFKEDMDRNITWKDVRLILPTLLILLFTVLVTVIPYAFSSVFRQMEAVRAMEAEGLIHSLSLCVPNYLHGHGWSKLLLKRIFSHFNSIKTIKFFSLGLLPKTIRGEKFSKFRYCGAIISLKQNFT